MEDSNAKSAEVDKYILSHPPEVQRALQEVRSLIWESSPYVSELMNYNIPAFSLVVGGKREQQLMIAGYKKHIGFYPHPDVIEQFKEQLSDFKFAKGSVQFPLNKPMPKDLIKQMVRLRVSQLS
ncbi:iron chaperone [Bowmanella denitrificans]|uniref:iron chaperone n=1 Tax=Bowmanella denitrificans TaxID=366582 RepID=UPI000C9ABCB1|nr:DUF1801 domain-containing protein [Bowmanella denitrificans]